MNHYGKRGAALLLCMCMIFITACGSGAGGGDTDKAMGRYVENRLEFPDEDPYPATMLQRSDGTLDVIYAKYDEKNLAAGTSYVRYNSADGEKWEAETLKWTLPKDSFLSSVAYDSEDRAHVMAVRYTDGIEAFLFRENGDGALEPVDITLKDESGAAMNAAMLGTMEVADNGNIFVEERGGGVGEYGPDGSFIRYYGSGGDMNDSSGFALVGNKMYVVNTAGSGVLCYSIEDGSLAQDIAFDGFSDYSIIAGGAEGAVYISSRNGIYRLNSGGSMWEKLVDGGLTSLAMPSVYFGNFIEGTDGSFYILGSDGETAQLYKYVYDPDIATLPEKELVVYALRENASLRVAAGEFQRDHPDTRVNIQIALSEDSAATAADMIRTLNTELLSGKGPDVLLLGSQH